MKTIFKWLKARAKEPSTWAGIASIAASFGIPQVAIGAKIIGGIIGGALVAHPEADTAGTPAG